MNVELLGRGFAWLDTGTHHSLLQAGQFVKTVEDNQGIKIACLEEVAYRMGFVTKEELIQNIEKYKNNEYFTYVREVLNGKINLLNKLSLRSFYFIISGKVI